jgi:hypothetical protein
VSGKRSRDKGARGERRAVAFFQGLGLDACRVSSLETNPATPVKWDVQVDTKCRGYGWNVQAKEVRKNCPALPTLMEHAHIGFVHYTNGRTFVVIDADDLEEFAIWVTEARGVGAAVDNPEHRAETGQDVAGWIGKGFIVTREPVESVRAGEWCVKPCPERPVGRSTPKQLALGGEGE